ncbi:hypothetical protein CFH99_21820 [Nocardioides aromaticivorans]|uniref:Integral membrane protein n=1 Tax=Nocardioides aromaticivorans TaxID=200618 RepID=A0ABX7PQJ1_9ACTN|nr:hypothetical protein [Nocardioides aromaticivorans]QSR28265.1 hypothetical protein CFH99_21820 [Nocardioides aromaticivorans]
MTGLVAGRVAAGLAVVSVGLHVAALGAMPPLAVLLMLAAALACLRCVPALWRTSDSRAWEWTAGTAAAMVALHLLVMGTTGGPAAHGGAAHAAAGHVAAHLHGEGWDLMHVASLVAGLEVVLAVGVLVARLAGRRRHLPAEVSSAR